MNVLNIHTRILNQPKSILAEVLKTLATDNDRIWPTEKWPKMKFKGGIRVGAIGGHGPIRYTVEKYHPEEIIQFRFTEPKGFNGIHKFEIEELTADQTQIKHTLEMNTNGNGTLLWLFGIRALHNALIEDGFDKLENSFTAQQKTTNWSVWVKLLRKNIINKNQHTTSRA